MTPENTRIFPKTFAADDDQRNIIITGIGGFKCIEIYTYINVNT